MKSSLFFGLGVVMATSLLACGEVTVFGTTTGTGGAGGDVTTSSSTGAGGTSAVGGSSGQGGAGASGGFGGSPPECQDGSVPVELVGYLDMVVMVDRSSSMAGPKWNDSVSEISDFAAQPWREGDRLSLNFHPDGQNQCDLANYTPMDVPLTAIPASSATIASALQNEFPQGASVLSTVMQASLQYAIDESGMPDRSAIAVILMDTQPNTCDTNPATFLSMATSALGQGVRTFVIGLQGQNMDLMDDIAMAGGTGTAFDLTGIGDSAQIGETLTNIRLRATPCEIPVPAPPDGFTGNPADFGLSYGKGGNPPEPLVRHGGTTCPDGTGFVVDDPSMPTTITLCGQACVDVKMDPAASLQVDFTCFD
ncbi:MAG: VWA domain-containing protein [Myxococcales bacterium]|nr:VWA domain-containing protein [Myxococcales bacterium]